MKSRIEAYFAPSGFAYGTCESAVRKADTSLIRAASETGAESRDAETAVSRASEVIEGTR